MSKPYHLVVFDWEGTLSDTLGHVLHVLSTEAKRLQLGEFDVQHARKLIGLGLSKVIQKIFPTLSFSQCESLLRSVQYELTNGSMEVWLIPGVEELLDKMRQTGLLLAIATNRGPQSLQRALEVSGIESFFTVTRSAGQVPAKPCPLMLQEIMDYCDVAAENTLMIGDSIVDVEMALLAGVDVVGVDFYNQQESTLLTAGAMAVFDNYQQVENYLNLVGQK